MGSGSPRARAGQVPVLVPPGRLPPPGAAAPCLGPAPGPRSERGAAQCGAAARSDSGHGPGPSPPAPGRARTRTPPLPAAPGKSRRSPALCPLLSAAAGPARSPRLASPGSRRCRRCSALVPLTFRGQILPCAASGDAGDAASAGAASPGGAASGAGRGGGREPLMEPGREKRSRGPGGDGRSRPGRRPGTRVPPSLTCHAAVATLGMEGNFRTIRSCHGQV